MRDDATINPWYLFEVKVADLLAFLENESGKPFTATPSLGLEANRWHLALREGLRRHLHIDLGMPEAGDSQYPILENTCALHAALLLEKERIKVVISGEWERAVKAGLISRDQLLQHESALCREMDGE